MDVNLKKFYSVDQGFAQFVERYGLVAAAPKTRKEFELWQWEQFWEATERKKLRDEGLAEGLAKGEAKGLAKGRAEGRAENQIEIALKAFSDAKSAADLPEIEKTLKKFGIPKDVIKSACERVKAERDEKS